MTQKSNRDDPRLVARRLDHLFRNVHPPTRGPYTITEVAEATGVSFSAIQQLRAGKKNNPTMATIRALAEFFGTSPLYFFLDDDAAQKEEAQLDLLAAVRDGDVAEVALRASGLSPDGLREVRSMVDYVRHREGLPPLPAPDEPGPRG
ncbi:helix-turn-helix transcriptional regulator [Streptomyces sp. B1866]|uniref:helix-turn-helix domain-containing protein n=1 Tax=Streptomyces sp. B1866 TaxID=3075431 RepID=UPI00289189AD|nr:helix-turn-helix transcriptional regulator [Streptomyces sp. B1866]MDT3397279.1 helix-turn-helix transcriptional regulator [Streptomyces sp. B1866]